MKKKIVSHYKAPIKQLGVDIEGYVLDEVDGKIVPPDQIKCVLSKGGFSNLLGLRGGSSAVSRTLTSLNNKETGSQVPQELLEKVHNPIVFKYLSSGSQKEKLPGLNVHGYETTTIIEVTKFILDAQAKKILSPNQEFLAEQAKNLLISLANTTLDALIYQESGFWQASEGQKLSQILDKYLQENSRKWTKTFPDSFWFKLIKMKGYPSYLALKRPIFVSHWVNDIVYDRLAPGVNEKLKKINPRNEKGRRLNKHHSFLTVDHGLPELKNHIIRVEILMDACKGTKDFERMINKTLPKYNDTDFFDFDED